MAGRSEADLSGDCANGLSTGWSVLNGNNLVMAMARIPLNLGGRCL
ncbi:hypothetical protein OAE26_00670 [Synechococcus sp. AH-551-E05]|nr:hypothetical protein [Synechococcus sp. AH-551-E05]MDB4651079.1 hypothetical protein [Synechococcus sp. AH-551-E05]